MPSLQLDTISLAYGDRDLLTSVTITLSEKTRAALAGANGSGKSTLMKIVCGIIEPDSGNIHLSRGARISYLPQAEAVLPDSTLYEAADEAFSYYHSLVEKLRQLETRLGKADRKDEKLVETLLLEHHEIGEILAHSEYYHREAAIHQVLFGLGFTESDLRRPCREFSGGWQMRAALARVLLEQADFLLLDEPTNYLDVEARIWLRNYLLKYSGGVLIVSHDRDFLDETVTEVHEIFQGSVSRFSGNYTNYERLRSERNEQLVKLFREQQEEIERIEQFAERFRYKDSKARQVQSRLNRLEKMKRIELPEHLQTIKFSFPPASHSGMRIFTAEDLSKSYGSLSVLSHLSFDIARGSRIAVSGKNGTGKSTLLRILAGEDSDYSGTVTAGTGLSIGYYPQDAEKSLTSERNVYEEIEHDAPSSHIPKLRSYLGAFLFRGDDVFKPVSILSGGEKSRLALLKLLLKPHNVLILDEPTNHLDLSAKDVLLDALAGYSGTLIFVSHDSYFMRKLADRIFYLSDTGMERFEGDYEYFSWVIEQRNRIAEIEEPGRPLRGPEADRTDRQEQSIDRRQRNAQKNRQRTLRRQEEDVLSDIEHLERKIEGIHASMADPDTYQDGELMKACLGDLKAAEERIELLYASWEAIHEELEQLAESVS